MNDAVAWEYIERWCQQMDEQYSSDIERRGTTGGH